MAHELQLSAYHYIMASHYYKTTKHPPQMYMKLNDLQLHLARVSQRLDHTSYLGSEVRRVFSPHHAMVSPPGHRASQPSDGVVIEIKPQEVIAGVRIGG